MWSLERIISSKRQEKNSNEIELKLKFCCKRIPNSFLLKAEKKQEKKRYMSSRFTQRNSYFFRKKKKLNYQLLGLHKSFAEKKGTAESEKMRKIKLSADNLTNMSETFHLEIVKDTLGSETVG